MDPHELIQQLLDTGIEELDRSVVDRFLECGSACVQPVLDFIRLDMDDAATSRAVALLGELGSPALMEELTSYFAPDEEDEDAVSEMAEWAFQRLIARDPAGALAEIQRIGQTAEPHLLIDLSQRLSLARGVPDGAATLLSFGERLDSPDLDAEDRATIVSSILTAAMVMDTPRGELPASIRARYGKHLTPAATTFVREIEQALLEEPVTPDELPDIYQVCCAALVEEETGPYVRPEPKIGRNDLCWCGSGKKYKKCHLGTDEAQ
jgi:hypothetical protein